MELPSFGKSLIEIRKSKGLTQEEVAEMCDITVRTIQRIESGSNKPRAYTIKKISEVLEIDFFDLENAGNKLKNSGSKVDDKGKRLFARDLLNLNTNTMKKISILTTVFIIVGLGLNFALDIKAQSEKKNRKSIEIEYNKDKSIKRIEVAFTNQLSFDSLVYINDKLKEIGINVKYSKLVFDKNDKLSSISCKVDNKPAGNSGSFYAPSFNPPLDKNKKPKNGKYGFYYDYSENADSAFGIGYVLK